MISAKVMLLGEIGVGKTSLARRFVFDKFEAEYKTTIGVDVLTHDVRLGPACGDAQLRFVLWDTDGDFGTRIFETVYLAGASAAIIVADATRPATVVKLAALAEKFEQQFPGRPVARLLNKVDLAPQTSRPGDGVVFTSAKTGDGVAEMFQELGAALWRATHY